MFLREAYYLSKVFRQKKYSGTRKRELQLFFLKNIVEHAYAHNRFYRRLYDRARFHPRELESLADLENIPVVRKEDILKGRGLFYDASSLAASRVLYTSGSTGDPFRVYLDGEASDYASCIFLRTLMDQGYKPLSKLGFYWYREERNSSFGRLGLCRKVLFSAASTPKEQLEAIRRHRLRYLYHFPFKLYEFANAFDEATLRDLHLRRIFCTGELLTPRMRAFIEERFGCPVTDNYGLTEFNIAAYQRPGRDDYTVNEDSVLIEAMSDAGCPPGTSRPVITSFFNYTTPFVRYRMDDLVETRGESITRLLGRDECFFRIGPHQAYLGDLVDVLVGFSEEISLFSFTVGKGVLQVAIVPKKSYGRMTETLLSAQLRSFLPIQIRIIHVKKMEFLERGKHRILRFQGRL